MKLKPAALLLLTLAGLATLGSYFLNGTSAGNFDPKSIDTGDTTWVLIATALVMLMTPAVGFFYGGMVRSKNIVSVIKQSLMILAVVTIQWMLVGYSLVFGEDRGGIIGGLNFAFLRGVGFAPNNDYAATIPHLLFMMFQGMFAIITPALIIGAIAERFRFRTLIIFTLIWTTFIYDPIAHWVWGMGGWLRTLGALDFAGGNVVHISAGFSALAAALLVGRRHKVAPHSLTPANNVPLVLLGTALLWFGWFGFNAGSALSASALAVNAFIVTHIAAAAAAATWMILSYAESKKPSAIGTAVGAVCGLVAITPASGFVGPIGAVAIGMFAGLTTYFALLFRLKKTRIDDTLDVWAAHGIGGVTGAILTGVFAQKAVNSAGADGLLHGNWQLVGIQILSVAVTALFAFVGTYILLTILRYVMSLRVDIKEEQKGLDIAIHGEPAYHL